MPLGVNLIVHYKPTPPPVNTQQFPSLDFDLEVERRKLRGTSP